MSLKRGMGKTESEDRNGRLYVMPMSESKSLVRTSGSSCTGTVW